MGLYKLWGIICIKKRFISFIVNFSLSYYALHVATVLQREELGFCVVPTLNKDRREKIINWYKLIII